MHRAQEKRAEYQQNAQNTRQMFRIPEKTCRTPAKRIKIQQKRITPANRAEKQQTRIRPTKCTNPANCAHVKPA